MPTVVKTRKRVSKPTNKPAISTKPAPEKGSFGKSDTVRIVLDYKRSSKKANDLLAELLGTELFRIYLHQSALQKSMDEIRSGKIICLNDPRTHK